jgi:hypothetical protein
MELPSLMNDLTERDDPTCAKSNIDNELPIMTSPYSETEEPILTKDLTDIEEPT